MKKKNLRYARKYLLCLGCRDPVFLQQIATVRTDDTKWLLLFGRSLPELQELHSYNHTIEVRKYFI